MKQLCPCGSKKAYATCCGALHKGKPAKNALELMKSRYSGYAMGQVEYMIRTTHPDNPRYNADFAAWGQEIQNFCRQTQFIKLEIVEFLDGENEAFVSFIAHMIQNGQPVILAEKSRFEKVDGQWLYRDGIFTRQEEPST